MNVHPSGQAPAPQISRLANPVWGQETASRRKNWSAIPNVWENRVVTPTSPQGNDIMHARYYAFNLGRFMSVDPVGGKPGLSQSWNRYAYVRGNPVNAIDPTGEKVRIEEGAHAADIREVLVKLIMRPSGRAELWHLARDAGFTVTYRNEPLLNRAQISYKKAHHKKAWMGNTRPHRAERGNKAGKRWDGANVSLDLRAIKVLSPDPSGVRTVAHENYHVRDFQDQKSVDEVLAGDDTTNGMSPAEKHGKDVSNEKTDITEEEAQKILNQMLAAGQDDATPSGGGQ